MKLKLLLFLCCLSFVGLNAQTTETLIQNYLERTHESLGVTLEDVQNIKIVSDYETQKTGLQHVVVQQTVNEIPVFNALRRFRLDPALSQYGRFLTSFWIIF